jgi:hypothetical protein
MKGKIALVILFCFFGNVVSQIPTVFHLNITEPTLLNTRDPFHRDPYYHLKVRMDYGINLKMGFLFKNLELGVGAVVEKRNRCFSIVDLSKSEFKSWGKAFFFTAPVFAGYTFLHTKKYAYSIQSEIGFIGNTIFGDKTYVTENGKTEYGRVIIPFQYLAKMGVYTDYSFRKNTTFQIGLTYNVLHQLIPEGEEEDFYRNHPSAYRWKAYGNYIGLTFGMICKVIGKN